MVTTGNLSGEEIPTSPYKKITKRSFPLKKKKNKMKKIILKENRGNYDLWNNPKKEIGKSWEGFFGILKLARDKNYFDTTKGQGGKFPSFFSKERENKK